ncbi:MULTISPECIES: hypothetical protein [Pseudomonas]|uniref:Uncharacterized protein n=1 Tax=Pseudomonas sessilinigenes TaxID=658629 RepID=A0ABX8MI58_9PSED|nr:MULTISPECIES: hypothetical protein [Pseudomonas]AZC27071.1 hypothetical protein C4K39_5428 [Pseudomonas sessilinigenes]QXH38977.1 hypothetical protein KSS89_22410 [Pseudomonas sessilinigenes]
MDTMNAQEFVALWKAEKTLALDNLRQGPGRAAEQFKALELDAEQSQKLWKAVDTALTDVFYTLLLGLDGAASIGGEQCEYQLRDEAGELISDTGEIEAEAYAQFHCP